MDDEGVAIVRSFVREEKKRSRGCRNQDGDAVGEKKKRKSKKIE